ncbi:hypothetical protein GcC1_035032, partial [Golovinomyces cichoracearum]
IVSYFTSSPKQLSYLREIIATTTGGVKALITTVPTRWGTQFLQIKSINRSSEALKIFAEKPDDINEPIHNLKASHLNRNFEFWQQNKEQNGWQARKARQVLPIHFVAYELSPPNWSKLTDPTEQEIIDNFILERGGVDAFDQLCQYRHKDSAFNPLRECRRFTEATKPFWNISV